MYKYARLTNSQFTLLDSSKSTTQHEPSSYRHKAFSNGGEAYTVGLELQNNLEAACVLEEVELQKNWKQQAFLKKQVVFKVHRGWDK